MATLSQFLYLVVYVFVALLPSIPSSLLPQFPHLFHTRPPLLYCAVRFGQAPLAFYKDVEQYVRIDVRRNLNAIRSSFFAYIATDQSERIQLAAFSLSLRMCTRGLRIQQLQYDQL